MKKPYLVFFTIVFGMFLGSTASAGTYAEYPISGIYTGDGVQGFIDEEVNPMFTGWATGYENYLPAEGVCAFYKTPEKALGEVTGSKEDIVSLGELSEDDILAGHAPGEITLTFDQAIVNGDGYDFAVFENGSSYGTRLHADLAYVQVSTNGESWAEFPGVSMTEGPVGGYGKIDPTGVSNLAGKHPNADGTSVGTGFDLEDLADNELVLAGLVDLGSINYVKIIDIPGSGDYYDSKGNPIYDAWKASGSTGGFDLEAVGVINSLPVPGAVWLLGSVVLVATGMRRKKAGI
jgi:hypothetical protein